LNRSFDIKKTSMRVEKSVRYTIIQEWIDRVVYLKQHIDSKNLLSDWQIWRASSRKHQIYPHF